MAVRRSVLLEDLGLPLEIERQVVFWMQPKQEAEYDRSIFPIWAYEYKPGFIAYGFPNLPLGVKASGMHSGVVYDFADDVDRSIHEDEAEALKNAIRPVLPGLAASPVRGATTCLFTNTPDHNFLIDFHPDYPRVLISSACSGHGFKFASVVGEIQADLVANGRSRFELSPFVLSRFR